MYWSTKACSEALQSHSPNTASVFCRENECVRPILRLGAYKKTKIRRSRLSASISARALGAAGSLRDVQTEHVDLAYVDSIGRVDLEQVMGRGGALDGPGEAQRLGLVRYIGVTAHNAPWKMARVLQETDVDEGRSSARWGTSDVRSQPQHS